ncbi:hypothetical protein [Staphylococcus agnetis]|uniref:hypothetical protein n=1 Tax=Staphylococcus agnetis TaxID=985762 RepID=UPI00208EC294|nr:hypothetical protein [Staphylococcus agnetis]MCO4353516.1 hypothetical protein [Staphylococcus agnetis]
MALYVVSGGKHLFLSQNGGFVNNYSDPNLRVFDHNTLKIAKLIAKSNDLKVITYKSEFAPNVKYKRISNLRNKVKKLTKYEIEHLLVIKNIENERPSYLTYNNKCVKSINNSKVIKLPMNEIGTFYTKVDMTRHIISPLASEVKDSLL